MEKLEARDRIVAPSNNLPPLKGKWIVEKVIDSPFKKEGEIGTKEFMEREALFHRDAIVVASEYVLEPTYNIRNVNLSDYLLYKFKLDPEYLGIREKEGQVITILERDQYFYEFIKYKEDEMIIFEEEKFFFLKRNAEEVSKEEIDPYINIEKSLLGPRNTSDLESLRTGIFLGIKSSKYDEEEEMEDWKYKTIWIRVDNRTISSVYEREDLLVPRKKGFWTIGVEREKTDDIILDRINSVEVTRFNEEVEESISPYSRGINGPILKNILYVGNDYISLEVINKFNNEKKLKVYPIDNLEKGQPTVLSDILGENDLKSFKDKGEDIFKSELNSLMNEESFGLVRRNGYWILKGRINYSQEGKELYEDYNIKSIPPKEVVNYDELSIPWTRIKSRFPEARDGFISPNEDVIIIDTRGHILIYPIVDNKIMGEELGRIKKDMDDTIVMGEWSTGKYTDIWEDEVLKNNGKAIEYK